MKTSLTILALFFGLSVNAAAALPSHDSQGQPLPSLAPMLEQVLPGVVNVAGKKRSPHYQRRDSDAQSLGSGVIVDAQNGYIVTNHHVIEGASSVEVVLYDGRRFAAHVIGTDPETDIAVIQIKTEGLIAIPMGESSSLRVGDFSIAIGNPFGLSQTVTTGIVSALGRSGLGIEAYENFIQTDASINPGNSGGALVNLNGELIGINTAIYSRSGGNIGIGFAIPVDTVKTVITQLIKYGEVKRGHLGAQARDLTPDIAVSLGLEPTQRGAEVTHVYEGSPADRAGLKPGDIIIEINGKPVQMAEEVRYTVGLAELGDKIDMLVLRDGKRMQIHTMVEDIASESDGSVLHPYLEGAQFGEIDEQHPTYGHIKAVVITRVERSSPAWRVGLRRGDIIMSANNREISSLAVFENVIKSSGELLLSLRRGNLSLTLFLP